MYALRSTAETGEYKSFRRWQIVADNDHEIPAQQIALTDAHERDPKSPDQ